MVCSACSASSVPDPKSEGSVVRSPAESELDIGLTLSMHIHFVPCEEKTLGKALRTELALGDGTNGWSWTIDSPTDESDTLVNFKSPISDLEPDAQPIPIKTWLQGFARWSIPAAIVEAMRQLGSRWTSHETSDPGESTSSCNFVDTPEKVSEQIAMEMPVVLASWVHNVNPDFPFPNVHFEELEQSLLRFITSSKKIDVRKGFVRVIERSWSMLQAQLLSPRTSADFVSPAAHWDVRYDGSDPLWQGQGVVIKGLSTEDTNPLHAPDVIVTAAHVVKRGLTGEKHWLYTVKQSQGAGTGTVEIGAMDPGFRGINGEETYRATVGERSAPLKRSPRLSKNDLAVLFVKPKSITGTFEGAFLTTKKPDLHPCDESSPEQRPRSVVGYNFDPIGSGLNNGHQSHHIKPLCLYHYEDPLYLGLATATEGLAEGPLVVGNSGSGLFLPRNAGDPWELSSIWTMYNTVEQVSDTPDSYFYEPSPLSKWFFSSLDMYTHRDVIKRALTTCRALARDWYGNPGGVSQREMVQELQRCLWPSAELNDG